jgi:hypothetical protein
MKQPCLLAGALLLGTAAHAAPSAWNFEYRGFYNAYDPGILRTDVAVTGRIVGDDVNGDGVISEPELESLWINMRLWSGDFAKCGSGTVDHDCQIDAFAFRPGSNVLDISAIWRDDYATRLEYHQEELVTGDHYMARSSYGHDYPVDDYYFFGSGTTLTITPVSPVPEPGAWMMLGCGLLALAALKKEKAGAKPAWIVDRKTDQ